MLGVAGVVSSSAQNVYSVNVVGYINLVLTNNFSLIANQLDNGANNLVTNMFTGLPNQTVFYKFNGTTYDNLTWLTLPAPGMWTPISQRQMTLSPGEGIFVRKPTGVGSINVTFVGEVLQGHLVNPMVAGFEVYSGMVPQAGGITSVHGFAPVNQDTVYKFNGVSYDNKVWLQALNRWNPIGEPVLNVGEAVFIKTTSARDWVRDFSVNQ